MADSIKSLYQRKKMKRNGITPFLSEDEIIVAIITNPFFISELGFNGWEIWQAREVKGLFGIPDLLFSFRRYDTLGREIIRTVAFEFKKSNWQRALIQAYKYASFANYSYVVLDEATSEAAINSLDKFVLSNIGLLSINTDGNIKWHHRPKYRIPYSLSIKSTFTIIRNSNAIIVNSNSSQPAIGTDLAFG
jgi:hypothetical protein